MRAFIVEEGTKVIVTKDFMRNKAHVTKTSHMFMTENIAIDPTGNLGANFKNAPGTVGGQLSKKGFYAFISDEDLEKGTPNPWKLIIHQSEVQIG